MKFFTKKDEYASTTGVLSSTGFNLVHLGVKAANLAAPIDVVEFLDLYHVLANTKSAGVPLLSLAGRVGKNQSGELTLNGVDYVSEPARHHILRETEFNVTTGPDFATGTAHVELAPAQRGNRRLSPASYDIKASIVLLQGAARYEVEVISTYPSSQPWNFGLHPYFPIDRSRPARICVPGRKVLEQYWDDREPTPTGKLLPAEARGLAFADGGLLEPDHVRPAPSVGPKNIDDILTDVSSDADGSLCGWIEQVHTLRHLDGSYHQHNLRRYVRSLSGDFRPLTFWQVYAPERDAFAIEPLENAPNAINLEEFDRPLLEPGERRRYGIEIGLVIDPPETKQRS